MTAPGALHPLDHLRRADHPFLCATDRCSFVLELAAPAGPRPLDCRRILRDFKCPPSAAIASARRARAKHEAVITMAGLLRAAVGPGAAQQATWVPIPPSKRPADGEFDDRLLRTLVFAFRDLDVDVRPVLYQIRSTAADHLRARRVPAAALFENLGLDLQRLRARPLRASINLFDDVLTTGKHYKCCERRLRAALPDTPIHGVFLVRRALPRRWRGPF